MKKHLIISFPFFHLKDPAANWAMCFVFLMYNQKIVDALFFIYLNLI